MQGWKMKIVSFIYKYKGNDWFTQTIKEMLDNFEKEIRADAIDELKDKRDEIIRWLIKRDKEGYGTTNGELLDHILEVAEQLKEQSNECNK